MAQYPDTGELVLTGVNETGAGDGSATITMTFSVPGYVLDVDLDGNAANGESGLISIPGNW